MSFDPEADTLPRLSTDLEIRRQQIVEALEPTRIRRQAVFDDAAEAMCSIANTTEGYVALMEDNRQCVVGSIGHFPDEVDREHTFCTRTLAAQKVVVVEDATKDKRFKNLPAVAEYDKVRFYVGVPLVVEEVPVGTICAIDDEPGTIERDQHAAMLGLARHIERFLAVYYNHDEGSVERDIVDALTRTASDAIYGRWRDVPSDVDRKLVGIEQQVDVLYDRLNELADFPRTYQFSELK